MASRAISIRELESHPVDATSRPSFQNVLFATDFSSASAAGLPYAVEIARRYGGILNVVHVSAPSVYPYAPAAAWAELAREEEAFCQEAKAKLEEELKAVPHELTLAKGDIWPALSDLIKRKHIDLVVLGTHGRSGIEKALMGSVAEKIFRGAWCPVLTVGPRVTIKSRRAAQLNRVLYATNFSQESLAAAPYAISLARENRAHLILLNCLEDAEFDVHAMWQTLRQLVPLGEDLRCEPICIVERGPHGQKILDVAESHAAELIVLGIDGMQERFAHGLHFQNSSLYKVATRATCPVLTVRA